jgi:post-segregation antitoxin (ccd killing protein)
MLASVGIVELANKVVTTILAIFPSKFLLLPRPPIVKVPVTALVIVAPVLIQLELVDLLALKELNESALLITLISNALAKLEAVASEEDNLTPL